MRPRKRRRRRALGQGAPATALKAQIDGGRAHAGAPVPDDVVVLRKGGDR